MGLLAAALVVTLGADGGPSASEMARRLFVAGDLRRAAQWCTQGLRTEPKVCRPMLKALAEYSELAARRDRHTRAEAGAFLAWDRAISPQALGALTQSTVARFIEEPMRRAFSLADAGAHGEARRVAAQVLEVDPNRADALSFAEAAEWVDAGAGRREVARLRGGTDGAVGSAEARAGADAGR